MLPPSSRVKVTVREEVEGLSEVLLKAIARARAWVPALEALELSVIFRVEPLAPLLMASMEPISVPE